MLNVPGEIWAHRMGPLGSAIVGFSSTSSQASLVWIEVAFLNFACDPLEVNIAFLIPLRPEWFEALILSESLGY